MLKWKPRVRPAGLLPQGWVGRRGCCRLIKFEAALVWGRARQRTIEMVTNNKRKAAMRRDRGPLRSRQGLQRVELRASQTLMGSKTASSLGQNIRGFQKRQVARDDGVRQVPRKFKQMRNGVLETRNQV